MTKSDQPSPSFEEAFARLEKILSEMSQQEVSLDRSLKLYEEADQLIAQCSKRLNEAEQKIEKLIKDRSGELELDPTGTPKTESLP